MLGKKMCVSSSECVTSPSTANSKLTKHPLLFRYAQEVHRHLSWKARQPDATTATSTTATTSNKGEKGGQNDGGGEGETPERL